MIHTFTEEELAAHDAEVRAESAEALDRAKRGAKTLGEIVERQVEDTLRWAGMEDQIGTDDPDQQLAWELCAEMPGKIAALEAELVEVRAGVVTEEPEWEYGIRYEAYPDADVVPLASEGRARAYASSGEITAMRRTMTAGPWVPVKQERKQHD